MLLLYSNEFKEKVYISLEEAIEMTKCNDTDIETDKKMQELIIHNYKCGSMHFKILGNRLADLDKKYLYSESDISLFKGILSYEDIEKIEDDSLREVESDYQRSVLDISGASACKTGYELFKKYDDMVYKAAEKLAKQNGKNDFSAKEVAEVLSDGFDYVELLPSFKLYIECEFRKIAQEFIDFLIKKNPIYYSYENMEYEITNSGDILHSCVDTKNGKKIPNEKTYTTIHTIIDFYEKNIKHQSNQQQTQTQQQTQQESKTQPTPQKTQTKVPQSPAIKKGRIR